MSARVRLNKCNVIVNPRGCHRPVIAVHTYAFRMLYSMQP